jgi:enoyl-CoA hydratase/carnithine racemase
MTYRDISLRVEDRVALITLNRPHARNAFSGLMGRELGDAYSRCDRDDEVRAVVLTGAGSAFCVGADFSAGDNPFAKPNAGSFSSAAVDPPAFRVRKPVIAAVNGHAVGLGLTLPMQCDIRVFAAEGKYGFLHTRRGVLPDAYAHFTVPHAIGLARAADLFLTGRTVDGCEAFALGLASRVVPAAEVLATAMAVAVDIAVNVAPLSAALSKRLLWEASDDPTAVSRKETALHHLVMGRSDALEGVTSFVEKRAPEWRLRVGEEWPEDWPE